MHTDYDNVKNILIRQGMAEIDAKLLVKIAKNRKTSVSRQLFYSLSGLYWFLLMVVMFYFLFIISMNEKETLVFSILFLSVLTVMFFFTPFFKKLLWSVRMLISLKGR